MVHIIHCRVWFCWFTWHVTTEEKIIKSGGQPLPFNSFTSYLQLLYRFFMGPLQFLLRSLKLLYINFEDPSQILNSSFTTHLLLLCSSFTDPLQHLYKSSLLIHRSFSDPLQPIFNSFPPALQLLQNPFTSSSQLLPSSFTTPSHLLQSSFPAPFLLPPFFPASPMFRFKLELFETSNCNTVTNTGEYSCLKVQVVT